MHMVTGSPLGGRMLCRVKGFLLACGLDWDENASFTAVLIDRKSVV